jgi:hypothetical protein
MTDFFEMLTVMVIALMMDAVRIFETSVSIYENIRCINPEGSHPPACPPQ